MADDKREDTSSGSSSDKETFGRLPEGSEVDQNAIETTPPRHYSQIEKLTLELAGRLTSVSEGVEKLQDQSANLQRDLRQGLEKQQSLQKQFDEVEASLSKAASNFSKDVDEHRQEILLGFENGLSAAQSAFSEQQAIRAPVELWQEKQSEHAAARNLNYRFSSAVLWLWRRLLAYWYGCSSANQLTSSVY